MDNFATDLGSSAAPNDSNWNLYSFNFNTTGASGAPVEFRIYGSGGSSTASNWRIDDLSITAAAVPEPATYMLFGMGLLVCAQQFRRRRAAAGK